MGNLSSLSRKVECDKKIANRPSSIGRDGAVDGRMRHDFRMSFPTVPPPNSTAFTPLYAIFALRHAPLLVSLSGRLEEGISRRIREAFTLSAAEGPALQGRG